VSRPTGESELKQGSGANLGWFFWKSDDLVGFEFYNPDNFSWIHLADKSTENRVKIRFGAGRNCPPTPISSWLLSWDSWVYNNCLDLAPTEQQEVLNYLHCLWPVCINIQGLFGSSREWSIIIFPKMVIIIQIIDGLYLYYFKMMICDYFDLNLSRVMWHFKARYVSIFLKCLSALNRIGKIMWSMKPLHRQNHQEIHSSWCTS
jgi:hypothetical protein